MGRSSTCLMAGFQPADRRKRLSHKMAQQRLAGMVKLQETPSTCPRPRRTSDTISSCSPVFGSQGDLSNMSHHGVSRRHFFFGALLAGAVPSGGYGSVPSLKALGYKPFYGKLNVAAIGCGGQGGVDLNEAAKTENSVALCAPDETRAA